ncbi:MAG TPA: FAD-dependent oxidoreductase, partial [Longimicrobiales bacterium]|nr:FAD-dependent oxidoreductase [Longimicrobiales bacterium]
MPGDRGCRSLGDRSGVGWLNTTRQSRVVVIGAGIIGCAVAWELARRGHDVTMIDRDTPGNGASRAAGGMLSPLSEADMPGPFLELGLASLERYPAMIEELRRLTGVDPGY